ncbi:MAG: MerR family transcriptional regulator [Pelosinus sp.]|nr:MerR family transcriptional regulator [Pelosinus sp.]
MRIKELSAKTGASVRSIRYYETKGLIIASRLPNSYRDYDESAIDKVKTIQLYLSLGLTTDEIAPIMECPADIQTRRPLCKAAYELYKIKLDEINRQIVLLQDVQFRLKERLREFEKKEKNYDY